MRHLVITCVSTLAAIVALRMLASRLGLIDRPGARKAHIGSVPVVGGLGMMTGIVLAVVSDPPAGPYPLLVLAISAAICILGALDDRYDLSPRLRLCIQFAAAIALVGALTKTTAHVASFYGLSAAGVEWLTIPLAVVAVVALINAFNMIDGVDGLAASVALVAVTAFLWLAARGGVGHLDDLALATIGALLAFFLFNAPTRANRTSLVFLGDAGSTLLGILLGAFALDAAVSERATPLAPAMIPFFMPIPIFELFASVVRRLLRGRSPFKADAGHFHHVLRDAGLSPPGIVILYFGFSAISAICGLFLYEIAAPRAVMLLVLAALITLWWLLLTVVRRLVHMRRIISQPEVPQGDVGSQA